MYEEILFKKIIEFIELRKLLNGNDINTFSSNFSIKVTNRNISIHLANWKDNVRCQVSICEMFSNISLMYYTNHDQNNTLKIIEYFIDIPVNGSNPLPFFPTGLNNKFEQGYTKIDGDNEVIKTKLISKLLEENNIQNYIVTELEKLNLKNSIITISGNDTDLSKINIQ